MKKRISLLMIVALVCVMMLPGCSTQTNKSVTYKVDTGDSVKITVNTKEGYDITMDVPFSVTKDDTAVITGTFIYAEYYDVYHEVVNEEPTAVLLDEGSRDGNDYFFYSVEGNSGTEYNYVVMINDSSTAVIMGSLTGETEAAAAFHALTISLD